MIEPRPARMFPLGSVLLPGAPLPLHIFETRYQQLLNETLEDDRHFGVALITRGWEVGGGDDRAMVGTRAVIQEHRRFDDGRAAVVARGVDRIEIVDWLPDAPYPRAMVRPRPTVPAENPAADVAAFETAVAALDRLVEVARSLGRLDAAPDLTWPDEPEAAAWHLASVAPITAHDRQRILVADRVADRLSIVTTVLDEMTEDLELMARLDDDA